MKRSIALLAAFALSGCSVLDLWKEPAIDFADRACVTDTECAGFSFTLNAELEQLRTQNSCVVFTPFCNLERNRCDVAVTTRDSDGDGARDLDPEEAGLPGDDSSDCRDSPFEPSAPDCVGGELSAAITPFDNDGDGHFGACSTRLPNDDCDDGNVDIYPGATDICDGWVNDCDIPVVASRRKPSEDSDGDGYGVDDGICDIDETDPARMDCDDENASVYPGALEVCDGVVNDCRLSNGGGLAKAEDDDEDGFSPANIAASICTRDPLIPVDCNDGEATVYPGAPEICDDQFNDCLAGLGARQEDRDGDGYPPYDGACVLRPRELGECAAADFDGTTRFCLPVEQPPIADSFTAPRHMALGDLDGDGIGDVVVVDGDDLKVFLGKVGGGFEDAIAEVGYSDVSGLALGNLDADPRLDIVLTEGGDGVTGQVRMIVNSDGAITSVGEGVAASGANGAVSPVVAELDADLVGLEIAFAATDLGDVNIITGLATVVVVDASFAGVNSVAAADIDGDGDLDLVGSNGNGGIVRWWANPGDGGASWVGTDLPVATMIGAVGAGDFDGDGDADIVVVPAPSTDGRLVVLMQGEAGAFEEVVVEETSGGSPSVRVIDLERDGRDEILVAIGPENTVAYYELEDGAWIRHDLATDLNSVHQVAAADMDGDFDLDVGAVAPAANLVTWWRSSFTTTLDWSRAPVDRAAGSVRALAVGDLDGDGSLDAVGASNTNVFAWQNSLGDGTRWTESPVGTKLSTRNLALADLDQDGDLDVVAVAAGAASTVDWFENQSVSGAPLTFATRALEMTDGASSVAIADFDGNGGPDILVQTATEVLLYASTGASPVGFTRSVVASGFTAAVSVAAGNFAGSAGVDFAVAADGEIAIFENTGAASFTAGPKVPGIAATGVLVAGYFDGDDDDGFTDLAFSSSTEGGLLVVTFDSGGEPIATGSDPAFGDAGRLVALDVDRDGDSDLVGAGDQNTVLWWENTATHAADCWPAHIIDGSVGWAFDIAAGDVDGDGFADALIGDSVAGSVYWYGNDGAAWWNP